MRYPLAAVGGMQPKRLSNHQERKDAATGLPGPGGEVSGWGHCPGGLAKNGGGVASGGGGAGRGEYPHLDAPGARAIRERLLCFPGLGIITAEQGSLDKEDQISGYIPF